MSPNKPLSINPRIVADTKLEKMSNMFPKNKIIIKKLQSSNTSLKEALDINQRKMFNTYRRAVNSTIKMSHININPSNHINILPKRRSKRNIHPALPTQKRSPLKSLLIHTMDIRRNPSNYKKANLLPLRAPPPNPPTTKSSKS